MKNCHKILAAARADRLSRADLARALGDRYEHDVHHADPGNDKRYRADQADDDRDGVENSVDASGELRLVEGLIAHVGADFAQFADAC